MSNTFHFSTDTIAQLPRIERRQAMVEHKAAWSKLWKASSVAGLQFAGIDASTLERIADAADESGVVSLSEAVRIVEGRRSQTARNAVSQFSYGSVERYRGAVEELFANGVTDVEDIRDAVAARQGQRPTAEAVLFILNGHTSLDAPESSVQLVADAAVLSVDPAAAVAGCIDGVLSGAEVALVEFLFSRDEITATDLDAAQRKVLQRLRGKGVTK